MLTLSAGTDTLIDAQQILVIFLFSWILCVYKTFSPRGQKRLCQMSLGLDTILLFIFSWEIKESHEARKRVCTSYSLSKLFHAPFFNFRWTSTSFVYSLLSFNSYSYQNRVTYLISLAFHRKIYKTNILNLCEWGTETQRSKCLGQEHVCSKGRNCIESGDNSF